MTAPLLRDFRATHPGAALQVRRLPADRIITALLDGSIDAALLHGPVDYERIDVLTLFTEARVAAISAASTSSDAPTCPAGTCWTDPLALVDPTSAPTGNGSSPCGCREPCHGL